MFPLKQTSGFFVRCLVVYGVLMIPWSTARSAYRACFVAVGNTLFHSFGPTGTVAFEASTSKVPLVDTLVRFSTKRPRSPKGQLDIKSSMIGLRPTAFVVALILASPIPWSRRWKACLWGLLWVNVFVALRVALFLRVTFNSVPQLAQDSFGPTMTSLLANMSKIFYELPVTHYSLPVFIWLLVTFRRGDIERILLPNEPGASPQMPRA